MAVPSHLDKVVAAACELVNEGASIMTALLACGLTHAQAKRLRKNRKTDPSWRLLLAAHAAARAGAEMAVRRDKPDVWLIKGPARNNGVGESWAQDTPAATVAVLPGRHTETDLTRLSTAELQALYEIEQKLAAPPPADTNRPAESRALKA